MSSTKNGEEPGGKTKSRMEVLAELRDMKRRRTKYRVAAKTRNYSDVLRDVIQTQMEFFGDAQKEMKDKTNAEDNKDTIHRSELKNRNCNDNDTMNKETYNDSYNNYTFGSNLEKHGKRERFESRYSESKERRSHFSSSSSRCDDKRSRSRSSMRHDESRSEKNIRERHNEDKESRNRERYRHEKQRDNGKYYSEHKDDSRSKETYQYGNRKQDTKVKERYLEHSASRRRDRYDESRRNKSRSRDDYRCESRSKNHARETERREESTDRDKRRHPDASQGRHNINTLQSDRNGDDLENNVERRYYGNRIKEKRDSLQREGKRTK